MKKYLYQALPFLREAGEERKEWFESYFRDAPIWVMDSFQIEEMPKGTIFVKEDEPADTIYFIAKGSIKATDYRFCGIAYDFMHLESVYVMGGMEVVLDLDVYRATLETTTSCTVVKMPRAKYEQWIKTDIRILRKEAKAVGRYLLEEGRRERAYLFLQGSDRLAMLFKDTYEKHARNGKLKIKSTRQDLSDATGLCVKTINRAVKKFIDMDLVSKEGNTLWINEKQYRELSGIVASVVEL